MPMITNDFSPYLQRAMDASPMPFFVFLPAGDSAAVFMKQFAERGMDKAGIKACSSPATWSTTTCSGRWATSPWAPSPRTTTRRRIRRR
jgi:ABC-type branched-subunit amino acid transport system substrate-binding protein